MSQTVYFSKPSQPSKNKESVTQSVNFNDPPVIKELKE